MLCSLGNCTGVFQDRVRGVLSGLSLALRPWTLRQEKKKKKAVILHKEVPPKGFGSWGVLSTLQQTYLSQLGSFFSKSSLAPYFPYDEVWFPWQTFQDPPHLALKCICSFFLGNVLFPPHPKSCILCQDALHFVLLLIMGHTLYSSPGKYPGSFFKAKLKCHCWSSSYR